MFQRHIARQRLIFQPIPHQFIKAKALRLPGQALMQHPVLPLAAGAVPSRQAAAKLLFRLHRPALPTL